MTISNIFFADSGTVNFEEFLQLMKGNTNINPETELREVFAVFDLNSDGVISSEELHTVLNNLGEGVGKVYRPTLCSTN